MTVERTIPDARAISIATLLTPRVLFGKYKSEADHSSALEKARADYDANKDTEVWDFNDGLLIDTFLGYSTATELTGVKSLDIALRIWAETHDNKIRMTKETAHQLEQEDVKAYDLYKEKIVVIH